MESKNVFYIRKAQNSFMNYGNYYDTETGEYTEGSGYFFMAKIRLEKAKKIQIKTSFANFDADQAYVSYWNKHDAYLGFQNVQLQSDGSIEFDVTSEHNAFYFAISVHSSNYSGPTHTVPIDIYRWMLINPHYKQLNKKCAKENGQVFFRESLDGKIALFGDDYKLVNEASIESTLDFYILRNNNIVISASFNKSDCVFDHFKKSVELKLKYNDKYSKILNAYDNTYDLIKLSPALTPITLTKRCVIQVYIQGENTISNYAGGTYWETEVNEPVDDEDLLLHKYHFAKGPLYSEVDLEGFNYDINAVYTCAPDKDVWNAVAKVKTGGQSYEIPCSIKFTKVGNANSFCGYNRGNVNVLSSGLSEGYKATYTMGDPQTHETVYYTYDTYRIEIYTGKDGTGTKIYASTKLYGKDTVFTLAQGQELYEMLRIVQPSPAKNPEPDYFNLGSYVINYQVWGRVICDADKVPSHEAGHEEEYIDTYDLPYDDFATARRNYRKCIGLRGFNSSTSVIKMRQTGNTSETPTPYGMNDFGEYFVPPYSLYGQYYYPLVRSSWGNTSLWIELGIGGAIQPFESFCAEQYKEYEIKDVYHIGDVIKSLLAKIDPSIKHEKTAEYSTFLYGHTGASAYALGNCDLYITQKTNILKGEYDQAAQKAEIKFKQLMEMLRDCFRCYWYIDNENRFRIEHVSYFMNGLSYYTPDIQLDLTKKQDKFNKKMALYCQQEVEYDKSDLNSRYEFKYADEVTKAMGGDLHIDVNNQYIQKNKTEEISIDGFTADIDYMLFLPDDFSNNGFALLMANSDKKVPIIKQQIVDEKQDNYIDVYVQNWYTSFNNLANHYMRDMPGNNISYNNIRAISVEQVKRCMKHNIKFTAAGLTIDNYRLIKTDIGNGYIEEVSTNIDTDIMSIELRYGPR